MVVLWVAFEGLQRGAAFLGMARPHGGYAAFLQNAPVRSGAYPGLHPGLVCRAPFGAFNTPPLCAATIIFLSGRIIVVEPHLCPNGAKGWGIE